ncbi:MAG TPA: toprim domain-containing protein [Candidatus Omnitrophota bacterium]|nr:toprim domain-containing protein [Candidatus Omnitrophota bacterium]
MARGDTDLNQIGDMLRARVGELVRTHWDLRDGFREGHDWVCRNPLRRDNEAKSFRIALSGPYQGMVKDFAGPFGRAGKDTMSALTFHAELCHAGDMGAAVKWAKAWLGLDGTNPEALRATHRAVQAYDDRPVQDDEAVAKRRKLAQRVFLAGSPLRGTPGWEYFKGRGLDPARLPSPINAFRFNPACFCGEVRRELPAVVMAINGMDGSFLGVHRIWIAERGGRWVKNPELKRAKKAFGAYAGGTVRIWNGQRVLERTGEVVYGRDFASEKGPMRIHLTEGPEDALAVALACPDERIHCAVSVYNAKSVAFPDKVTEVVLWRQADPPGSPAAIQFERVAANQHAQGKKVMVADIASVVPGVKDPAEVFQRKGGS